MLKISNCPGCEKTYSNQYNLKRHWESIHVNNKRFICAICSKKLSSNQNLQEHLYIHDKVKPFKCSEPDCGQTFRQRSQLCNHSKVHKEITLQKKKLNEFVEIKVIATQLTDLLKNTNNLNFFSNQEDENPIKWD